MGDVIDFPTAEQKHENLLRRKLQVDGLTAAQINATLRKHARIYKAFELEPEIQLNHTIPGDIGLTPEQCARIEEVRQAEINELVKSIEDKLLRHNLALVVALGRYYKQIPDDELT